MSTPTEPPVDRGTAERLLRGGAGAAGTGHHRLAGLLAAANAPARGGEVAREEIAVAAFREAHRSAVPRPQRQSMIKSVVAKLLTVKVAALVAAAAGVSGVALAASTGTIPSPLHGPSAAASHSPDHGKARPSDRPSARADRRDPAAVPSGFPPGLYWLCKDYIGRDADHRGKALGESKFRELANQAGRDRQEADRFCDKLLDDPPGGAPTAHPTGAPADGAPADKGPSTHKPSRAPGDRPGGSTPHPNR